MKKNNLLPNKGLSLSQAQSISNLCNQRANEIQKKFDAVNNFSKTLELGDKTRTLQKGEPLPTNTVDLIKEKARLHACQAFLMENIKAKDGMLLATKAANANISGVEHPKQPVYESPAANTFSEVDETWGWAQLTVKELNEFMEAEAFAAHIGQFIHSGSLLDGLRKSLPKVPTIEWITIKDGEKTPVDIEVHHTSEELMLLHEELAAQHRKYEQRVNYFKAKVKNLVTAKNAEIAEHNAKIHNEVEKANKLLANQYELAFREYTDNVQSVRNEFEKARQKRISEIASMRIDVDARFQDVVDEFLKQLENE